MKYMQWAASPRRTMTSPALAVCARNRRMIWAIAEASSPLNSGTRATMPQVTTKSRRWICSEKAVAMMPTGSAIMTMPQMMVTAAIDLAERRDRHDVAVADGAQRDDRPPHRVRDGAELFGLGVALGEMDEGRGHQRRAEQDDEAAEQARAARN